MHSLTDQTLRISIASDPVVMLLKKLSLSCQNEKNDYRILKAKMCFKNADVTKNGIPLNSEFPLYL